MGADVGEARLDFSDAVWISCSLGFLEQGHALAIACQHDVYQALWSSRCLLRQSPNGVARRADESAALHGNVAHNGTKQAGFSSTIAPDKPNSGAARNLQRRPVDHEPPSHTQRNIVEYQHSPPLRAVRPVVTLTGRRRRYRPRFFRAYAEAAPPHRPAPRRLLLPRHAPVRFVAPALEHL